MRLTRYVPVLLFLGALAIRLAGIGWGLPNDGRVASYHPDEAIVLGASQAVDPLRGDFLPGFYNYGTLYLTLLRLGTDLAGVSAADGVRFAATGHLVGRVISVAAGALLVLAVYGIGTRAAGRRAGAIAGAIVAIAPALVMHARFQTVDMLATALVAGALYTAMRVREGADVERWVLLGGVLAGAAAGTKYVGVVALVAVLVAVPNVPRRPALWLGALLATLVVFLVTTPGVILDRETFLRDLRYELNHSATGHGLLFVGAPPAAVGQLANLFVGYGTLLTGLGLASFGWAFYRRRGWALPLGVFFVIYVLAVARGELAFLRYMFPVIPVLAVATGAVMASASRRRDPLARGVVVVGIVAFMGVLDRGGVLGTAENIWWMTGPDPRDRAVARLRELGGKVGLASDPWYYTPPLWPEVGVSRAVPFERRRETMVASRPPAVVRVDPTGFYDWDPGLLTELSPESVVVTSLESYDPERLGRRSDIKEEVPALVARRYAAFAKELATGYRVDSVFGADGARVAGVHDLAYVRPVVTVWRRKDL